MSALNSSLRAIEYPLENFKRSNQDTCLTHKPVVVEGDWVQSGDLLTDCAASVGGELSLGQNILIAYMPWEGYNFEDAILVSERLVYDDLYTSVHIERYELETKVTKLGSEEITRDIPDINQKEIEHLDSNGIAKRGSWIQEGDILVGKITPITKKAQSPYQKLLYTILEKQFVPFRDSSLRAPKGIKAKVIDIKFFSKNAYPAPRRGEGEGSFQMSSSQKVIKNGRSRLASPKGQPSIKKSLLSTSDTFKRLPIKKATKKTAEPRLTLTSRFKNGFGTQAQNNLPFILMLNKQFYKQLCQTHIRKKSSYFTNQDSFVNKITNVRDIAVLNILRKLQNESSIKSLTRFKVQSTLKNTASTSLRSSTIPKNLLNSKLHKKNMYRTLLWMSSYLGYYKMKLKFLLSSAAGSTLMLSQNHTSSFLKNSPKFMAKFMHNNKVRHFGEAVPQHPLKGYIGSANVDRSGSGGPSRGMANNTLKKRDMGAQPLQMLGRASAPLLSQTNGKGHSKKIQSYLKKIETLHIYLAEKRKIQVGDKMAGRHGNKGIISQILPIQDMPYLPDGTPIDMVLNPLGVPSRMNVGQIYECLLGLAGKYLGEHYKVFPFDEMYGPEASRSFVFSKLYEARKTTGFNWLFNPNFPGKLHLYDGRTGDCFDQAITVGQAYMLRLVHMVDDKIHMRSTGPYSLVTQQPLRGRSKQGGQRLGEMEVWALEGYGAAFTLLEMLTIKSDDMTGRMTLWSNLILNKEISIGTPESFKVLVCELQALCLDMGLFRYNKINSTSLSYPLNGRGSDSTKPIYKPTLTEINNLMNLP